MHRRKYQAVSANTTVTDEYTLSGDEKLQIKQLGGDASTDAEVKVEITFDSSVIFSTHGSIVHKYEEPLTYTGNTKKLIIRLVNDSAVTETIGGFWEGDSVK
jgi:hypothetical protein